MIGDRATVVVDFDPDLPVPMELVSWQIGRAEGRRRARIGQWVDVPEFAALVVHRTQAGESDRGSGIGAPRRGAR